MPGGKTKRNLEPSKISLRMPGEEEIAGGEKHGFVGDGNSSDIPEMGPRGAAMSPDRCHKGARGPPREQIGSGKLEGVKRARE